ncbi:hypothetical protein ILYODFUR_013120 [Ilyodon furcidens]|uniref:Uncharacterized protein n=1 Tax=Ilyodon furcidens TaxID=33524 RepID=A0ABV0V684_9TELE
MALYLSMAMATRLKVEMLTETPAVCRAQDEPITPNPSKENNHGRPMTAALGWSTGTTASSSGSADGGT